jgi:glycosyltransferase 2 family protein
MSYSLSVLSWRASRRGEASVRSRSRGHRLVVALRVVAIPVAVVLVLRGVDLREAGVALATADPRWLLAALLLSFLSVAATAVTWGMLIHATNAGVPWRWIVAWHARTVLAGQVVPTGTAGDAVRVVGARRVVGTGPAIAGTLASRLSGGLGLVIWAVMGTVLLREALGRNTVFIAACLAGALMSLAVLLLTADLWVGWLAHRRSAWLRRLHSWLRPIVATLGSYRSNRSLLFQSLLIGLASWGLNLAALTALGRAVGADVGWQVFAVVVPLSLTATLTPLSVNGIGLREGILVGLLTHAGVAVAPAAALAVLVDVQMFPLAAIGGVLWLAGAGESGEPDHVRPASDPVPVPVEV